MLEVLLPARREIITTVFSRCSVSNAEIARAAGRQDMVESHRLIDSPRLHRRRLLGGARDDRRLVVEDDWVCVSVSRVIYDSGWCSYCSYDDSWNGFERARTAQVTPAPTVRRGGLRSRRWYPAVSTAVGQRSQRHPPIDRLGFDDEFWRMNGRCSDAPPQGPDYPSTVARGGHPRRGPR